MSRLQIIASRDVFGKEKIKVRIPSHGSPTHLGEMVLEEFLNPMALTQRELADAIHVPYHRINRIVNGRRSAAPSTALRLAKFFEYVSRFLDEPAVALGYVLCTTRGDDDSKKI